MARKTNEGNVDGSDEEIAEWRIPPADVIIRRNLKHSSKRRISRSQLQNENADYEVFRENSNFSEHPEDELYPRAESTEVSATRRISPTDDGKLSLEEQPTNGTRTVTAGVSTKADAAIAVKPPQSELHPFPSQEPSAQAVERSRPDPLALSVSFNPDLGLAKSISIEQRSAFSKIVQSSVKAKFSFRDLDFRPQRPHSCHASVGSRSDSRASLLEHEHEPAVQDPGFSTDRSTQEPIVQPDEDSDEYDTDLDPGKVLESQGNEAKNRQRRLDTDIGHITYTKACDRNRILPRTQVCRQLWETKLNLRHAELLTPEVKAVALALTLNHRVEEVDMSNNSLTDQAVTYLIDTLISNIYVTKLSLAGSKIETKGATVCGTLLSRNRYLLSLNLSGCFIGDSEVGYLAQGIRVNSILQHLNLSGNRIGPLGAMQLGKAVGENSTLTTVDLSWNHIRGGGAVALGNSLRRNKKLEELDLSWNGLGFEGSIAFGETLRVNKALKKLNLENNRINWDGVHYLAKGLAVNRTLEDLQIGLNPISMKGCEEILKAVAKSTSRIRTLSFKDIPINTKLALRASDITRSRDFTLQHGGILVSKDRVGIQRPRREDPFFLLIRYLSIMAIRVVDLFRMFDKDNELFVTKERFIEGLKKVRVPLDDADLQIVAKRLRSNKRGEISYQELATSVRNRIVKNREETKELERIQVKKEDEKLRVLQLDKPLHEMSNLSTLYGMFESGQSGSVSGDNSSAIDNFRGRDSGFTPLPRINNGRSVNLVGAPSADLAPYRRKQKAKTRNQNSDSLSKSSASTDDPGREFNQRFSSVSQRSMSSYVSEMKMQNIPGNLTGRNRFM